MAELECWDRADRADWCKKKNKQVCLNHTSSSTVAIEASLLKQYTEKNDKRKRPKLNCSIPPKKVKRERISEEVRQNIKDQFCCDLDIFEIYHTIRMSESNHIPFPRALSYSRRCNNNNNLSVNQSRVCSGADRKNAILSIFSRRSGLGIKSESLHLAVGILDKCLDKLLTTQSAVFDVAVVSLILATKQEQVAFLSIKDVVSCGLVKNKTVAELAVLERIVFSNISYRVSFPTPYTFANYLLVVLNASRMKINMTQYLLELAVLSVKSRLFKSEELAHASTCLTFAICVQKTMRANYSPSLFISSIDELIRVEKELEEFSLIREGKTRNIMKYLLEMYKLALTECHEVYVEYEHKSRDLVAICSIDADLEKFLSKY